MKWLTRSDWCSRIIAVLHLRNKFANKAKLRWLLGWKFCHSGKAIMRHFFEGFLGQLSISTRLWLGAALFLFFVGMTLRISGPILLSWLVGASLGSSGIWWMIVLYALTLFTSRVCVELQFASHVMFEQGFQKQLSLRLLHRFLHLPFEVAAMRSASENAIIADRGLNGIRNLFDVGFFAFGPLSIEIAVFLWIMGSTVGASPTLSSVVVIALYLAVTFDLSDRISTLQRRWFETATQMFKLVSEILRSYQTIRSFGQDSWATGRYAKATDGFISEVAASLRPGVLLGFIQGALLFILVLIVNTFILFSEKPLAEVIAALVLTNIFLVQIVSPLLQLSGAAQLGVQSYSAARQLFDVFKTPSVQAKIPHHQREDVNGISVPAVDFSVGESSLLRTSDCIYFPASGFTVITGKSGAGKTTLGKVVAGLFDPGVVVSSSHAVEKIFWLGQDADIFDLTLEENICLGEPLDDLRLAYALERAGIGDQERKSLSNRKLGEMGKNVSAGQKQRIGLARLVYFGAEVMVLDEPTASLDEVTKVGILETLRELSRSHMLIVITHDEAVAELATHRVSLEPVARTQNL